MLRSAAGSTRCEVGDRHLDGGPLEDLDALAFAQLHDRLLPAGLLASVHAAPFWLGLDLEDVHALDVHVEQLLDRLPDLRLVRLVVHAERVLVALDQAVALLRHDRSDEDVTGLELHRTISSTRSRAAWLASMERAHTSAPTSRSDGSSTSTRSRLRNDLTKPSSSGWASTTRGRSLPHASTSAAAAFVDGSPNPVPSTTASEPFWACLVSAARRDAFRVFRFSLIVWLRGSGGKATPPPVHCGAR